MLSDKFDIKGLFGVFGVDSLVVLGIFFILNGLTDAWSTIEDAAELKGWDILVSIPVVVVSYVFGIIAIETAQLFEGSAARQKQNTLLQKVIAGKDEFLQSLYVENVQTQRLLNGGSIAFIFVAVGAIMQTRWPGLELLAAMGAFGAALLAILCRLFSRRAFNRFYQSVQALP